MLFAFLSSGSVWLTMETLFFVVDMAILISQLYHRVITLKGSLLWLFAFYIAPLLGFIGWLYIGRATFRREPPLHKSENTEELERLVSGKPWGGMARAINAGGAFRYSEDSTAEYFGTGTEFYTQLHKDISDAKQGIFIECYIIRRDPISREFLKLLCRKASEGCEVKVIFDDYGYDGGTKKYLRMLESAGAEVALFHNMTKLLFSPKKNYRNHHKTFVIDGEIAYHGGFNIGMEYLGRGPLGEWRDGALRITGPQVQQHLRMFADMWEYTSKKDMRQSPSFHDVEATGSVPMHLVSGIPIRKKDDAILSEFNAFCKFSQKSLWIESPYFVPPRSVLEQIRTLASSGIDVKVIIPSKEDHPMVYWANRKYAAEIMRAGARVFEYTRGFIHSKFILGDGMLCSVGSANFDNRSTCLNFECNIVAYSVELGKKMIEIFENDLRNCTEYTLEMYESRSISQKIRTGLAGLFEAQLRCPNRHILSAHQGTHDRQRGCGQIPQRTQPYHRRDRRRCLGRQELRGVRLRLVR